MSAPPFRLDGALWRHYGRASASAIAELHRTLNDPAHLGQTWQRVRAIAAHYSDMVLAITQASRHVVPHALRREAFFAPGVQGDRSGVAVYQTAGCHPSPFVTFLSAYEQAMGGDGVLSPIARASSAPTCAVLSVCCPWQRFAAAYLQLIDAPRALTAGADVAENAYLGHNVTLLRRYSDVDFRAMTFGEFAEWVEDQPPASLIAEITPQVTAFHGQPIDVVCDHRTWVAAALQVVSLVQRRELRTSAASLDAMASVVTVKMDEHDEDEQVSAQAIAALYGRYPQVRDMVRRYYDEDCRILGFELPAIWERKSLGTSTIRVKTQPNEGG